jgi:hypothetical protein
MPKNGVANKCKVQASEKAMPDKKVKSDFRGRLRRLEACQRVRTGIKFKENMMQPDLLEHRHNMLIYIRKPYVSAMVPRRLQESQERAYSRRIDVLDRAEIKKEAVGIIFNLVQHEIAKLVAVGHADIANNIDYRT